MNGATRVGGSLILSALLLVTVFSQPAGAADAGTVLITGANRGIGLGFVRAYADQGWQVIATCRSPDAATELQALAADYPAVSIEALDVTDAAGIQRLAALLDGKAIDILINNAGITGNPRSQLLGRMDLAEYERVLAVNTLGPLRVAEAFLPHLRAGAQRKIVNISTSEASFGMDRGPARIPFYRSSKVALNMLMLNYAKMAAADDIAVALVNPGPVDTDMMRGVNMPKRSVALAVSEVMAITEQLNLDNSGTFWNYDGSVLAW